MQPIDQVALNRDIMMKGAGAFPTGGGEVPKPRKTALANYADPRTFRRAMRKK